MIERVAVDAPEAVALEKMMQDEYILMYGKPDQDPDNAMHGARGVLLCRAENGEPAGIGAWSLWPNGDGKVRLLYVRPSYRSHGMARTILRALEQEAMQTGAVVMRFESGPKQEPAHRLYDSEGYDRTTEGFGFYKDAPGSVFFRRVMVDDEGFQVAR